MGGTTAPVSTSGSPPAWTATVSKAALLRPSRSRPGACCFLGSDICAWYEILTRQAIGPHDHLAPLGPKRMIRIHPLLARHSYAGRSRCWDCNFKDVAPGTRRTDEPSEEGPP